MLPVGLPWEAPRHERLHHGRLLSAAASSHEVYCNGAVHTTPLQTTFFDAIVDFSLLDAEAKPDLWSTPPLLGAPRPGALRVACTGDDLKALRQSYQGLHLEPLIRAIRKANGSPPVAPIHTGVLILPDYHNLFHQFGSVAITWAALQESWAAAPDAGWRGGVAGATGGTASASGRGGAAVRGGGAVPAPSDLLLFMLNNASLAPTSAFWSPGLSSHPPIPATRAAARGATRFRRLVLVQPTTESWWWNVWQRDGTDRRHVFNPLVDRLLAPMRVADWHEAPAAAAATAAAAAAAATTTAAEASEASRTSSPPSPPLALQPGMLCLVLSRPVGSDRRLTNEAELVAELERAVGAGSRHQLAVRLVDMASMSTARQLSLVRSTAVLIGAHGAGLVWDLFLPRGACVVELLNMANANRYYANHALWLGRPYATWQNGDPQAEAPPMDPTTRLPIEAPFRNDMRVDARTVAGVVAGLLGNWTVSAAAS